MSENVFDGKDYEINPALLSILLSDRTTKKNIIWATNNCKKIQIEELNLIQPRYKKIREQQKIRTRDKAEIFTPSRLCNEQNNLIDEAWFGKPDVFNVVDFKTGTWKETSGKISFDNGRTWQDYVSANRMEITCGEAPYLVSRYDSVSGEKIPIEKRIGILDRKLRVVCENTSGESEFKEWMKKSVQSVYGYEFQGDNLFIARKNVFLTCIEYFEKKFCKLPDEKFLSEIAEIISWNLWQMDGLTGYVPDFDNREKPKSFNLFDDESRESGDFVAEKKIESEESKKLYCKIKDWKTGKEKDFANLGV